MAHRSNRKAKDRKTPPRRGDNGQGETRPDRGCAAQPLKGLILVGLEALKMMRGDLITNPAHLDTHRSILAH